VSRKAEQGTLSATETAAARRDAAAGFGFALPAALFTALFFIVPVGLMAAYSLFTRLDDGTIDTAPSLANYMRFFGSEPLLRSLLNSVQVSLLTTAVSLLLAYPMAYVLAFQVPKRWQRLLLALAILPFWTSYVVRSYAWLLVLAPTGIVNQTLLGLGLTDAPVRFAYNTNATVLGFVHFFIMLNALTIYASLVQINPRYALAARDLGASRLRTFLSVILPLSVPGIAVGGFLTFVLAMGDYITPEILGGNRELLLPQAIMFLIGKRSDFPMAAAMSFVLMAAVLLAYLATARWQRMGRV
jgi:spermidine/putrescine transport system permease protein